MSKAPSHKKQEAANQFAALFDGTEEKPTPEKIVVDVMHGTGNNKISERQLNAALALLPYRLPKLNTIDAHVATEEMSHEDWINTITGDSDDE